MVLNPGAMGDGLRHAFNQGRDDDKPTSVPTPTGLNTEDEMESQDKAYVRCNADPNLYNTESGQIPVNDNQMVESGSNRTERDLKRLNRVKLGDNLMYRGGEGTVVARGGTMVKIADNDSHIVTTIPVSETYFKDDILASSDIKAQMWDLMARDQRSALLSKSGILDETQKAYLYRDWDDVPEQVQGVIKEIAGEPPHGGVEGREPTHNDQNEESRSFRDLTQPAHVTEPYTDKQAPAFNKSDVEHGAYGGIVTDTNIDATDEYEDDRPKKPLSGAQTAANEGPSGQSGNKRDVKDEPKDPKKSPGVHDRWSENRKGDQQQAAITGKPDLREGDETVEKDEDSGVGQQSSGFQGAKPNAQASEKGEQQQAAITGKPDLKKEEDEKKFHEDEVDKEGDKTFADGPKRIAEKNYVNKYNTRWGLRQASEDDIKRLLHDKE